mmetsp:Transcript_24596/g.21778  ORF Transcript_24596/g.21778 Transcript_24596/m.21778 type:complete len:211 (-) Transcript_24596:521-1153(-)
MELASFIIDHRLKNLLSRFKVIKAPIKYFLTNWLIIRVVEAIKVGMGKTFLDCISFIRVEHKHFTQEIKGKGVSLRVEGRPGLFASLWKGFNVFKSTLVAYESQVFRGWGTQNSDNSLNLIKIVLTWEERGSAKQLSKDATDRPDINGFSIFRSIENNLRSTIPTSYNVFSLEFIFIFETSSKTQITNLEITIFIQQDITWLKISMHHIS